MKRLISSLGIMLIVFMLFSTTGCRKAATAKDDKKITVTSVIFPSYDFVRAIAKDRVNNILMISPGSESHSFEPSPKDILNIQNSNIFIHNGGESDKWLQRIFQSANINRSKILTMMDVVDLVEEEIVEGMETGGEYDDDDDDDDHYDQHDHMADNDHEELEYDEHVWTSPKNAIIIIRAITEILCEADAANSAFFQQNADAYIQELKKIDFAFEEIVAGAKRKTIVFGDRFPFRYLANTYGLKYYAAFPGCSTQTEPSVATVAFLINKIRSEKIPVIFHLELTNDKVASTISEETGAKKLMLHSAHNVSMRDFNSGLTYLDIQKRNVQNLKEALW